MVEGMQIDHIVTEEMEACVSQSFPITLDSDVVSCIEFMKFDVMSLWHVLFALISGFGKLFIWSPRIWPHITT